MRQNMDATRYSENFYYAAPPTLHKNAAHLLFRAPHSFSVKLNISNF
jgi:hypothetical protein